MLKPGDLVDRYRLLALLGTGGMAEAWKVEDTALGGTHALKLLLPELLAHPDLRRRFLEEGRIQAKLLHPHIVRVTNLVATAQHAGLVMDLVEGPTLAAFLEERGAQSPDAARQLLEPLLDAVAFLHGHGVVHRDLKPENVLLGPGPTPMILDFGIAKQQQAGGLHKTRTGTAMGTPGYMAPEQFTNAKLADERTDIYALGLILHELLSGKARFEGDSLYSVMNAVVDGQGAPLPDTVPGHLREVVALACAVDPSDRFANCRAFSTALARGTPDSAPIAAPVERPTPPQTQPPREAPNGPQSGSRSRGAMVGAIGLALTVTVAAVVATLDFDAPQADPDGPAPPGLEEPAPNVYTNSVGAVLVTIPAGRFTMGSPSGESGRDDDDEGQVQVELTRSFWLMTTEVTQGQYRAVTGENPSHFKGDDLPVENVIWLEAVNYANALSEREDLSACYTVSGSTVSWPQGVSCEGYRLPTEAEWEFAARGGEGHVYSGSSALGAVAWYSENSGSTTHGVGGKKPNAFGLYDMSGNVWEWVWDLHGSSLPGGGDPVGPNAGSKRVNRGGSWYGTARHLRVAYRSRYHPDYRNTNIGFRLARTSH